VTAILDGTVVTDGFVHPYRAGTLYDVMELILDRGMVIDAFVRISLVGIEIIKIDARIVVASVDTYLRFAEACNRLDLERDSSRTVPELFGGNGSGNRNRNRNRSAKEELGIEDGEDGEEKQERRPAKRRRAAASKS
jgi:hypothetical protein